MPELPPLAAGFVRLAVRLPPGLPLTPGNLAKLTGLGAEHLGPISISEGEAFIDITAAEGRTARFNLTRLGPAHLAERRWQWLRFAIGRNHGLSMGQLRRVLQNAAAHPVGKIIINNTHTLVGLADDNLPTVLIKLESTRVNGFGIKPSALPFGTGPGSPAFAPRD